MKISKIYKRLFLSLVLLVVSINTFSKDPNFYIFICFGQSNMEGQGAIEAQDRNVDNRFKVFQALDCPGLKRTKATWYTAVPPLCQCNTGLSPADYFGRTMVANLPDSITIGIINVSIGGCDIRLFDKDVHQDYDSTYNEEWYLSKVRLYDWKPRERLIELAKLAQKDGVIKGILLHQGEQNTGDTKWPSYVKKVYNDMLAELSLNADSVPLLAGEVLYTGVYKDMNQIIPQLPKTVPTAHVISAVGLDGDWAHFTSEGYRLFGMRYAEKMLNLLGIKTKVIEPEATYFEAECSAFGNNWNFFDDNNASNNSYLTIKQGISNVDEASKDSANTIYFNFTAKYDTSYYVYARVNCLTAANDSYWIKVDDEAYEFVDNLSTTGWKWLKLKSYNLKAGKHTLAIANGEEGAKLDKIFIANYNIAPTGLGSAAVRVCNNTVHTIPGKIEAELFLDQNGIKTESCADTGGGLNIGWIDNNDWLEYSVNVLADTVYHATFRCSSANSGGAVSILLDGEEVGSVSFTGTGTWGTYKSFTKDIPLKAGKHKLKLLVTTGGFNINWVMLENDKVTALKVINDSGLKVFPNPTNGEMKIESKASLYDNIEIIDITGKIVYSKSIKPAKLISFNPGLRKGNYILKLSSTIQSESLKIFIE